MIFLLFLQNEKRNCIVQSKCLIINKINYESVRNRFHFNSRFI